jgi:hypothetical protein
MNVKKVFIGATNAIVIGSCTSSFILLKHFDLSWYFNFIPISLIGLYSSIILGWIFSNITSSGNEKMKKIAENLTQEIEGIKTLVNNFETSVNKSFKIVIDHEITLDKKLKDIQTFVKKLTEIEESIDKFDFALLDTEKRIKEQIKQQIEVVKNNFTETFTKYQELISNNLKGGLKDVNEVLQNERNEISKKIKENNKILVDFLENSKTNFKTVEKVINEKINELNGNVKLNAKYVNDKIRARHNECTEHILVLSKAVGSLQELILNLVDRGKIPEPNNIDFEIDNLSVISSNDSGLGNSLRNDSPRESLELLNFETQNSQNETKLIEIQPIEILKDSKIFEDTTLDTMFDMQF